MLDLYALQGCTNYYGVHTLYATLDKEGYARCVCHMVDKSPHKIKKKRIRMRTGEYSMDLKCRCRKLSARKPISMIEICIRDVSPTDILVDKLMETGKMYDEIHFGYYYPQCNAPCSCTDTLPYILRNGKFVWEENIRDVTVEEFLETHNLTDNDVLQIDTSEGSGGAGWEDVVEAWATIWPIIQNDVYPALRVAATTLSLGNQIIKFLDYIPKRKTCCAAEQCEPVLPDAFFSAILSRDKWSKMELAESMDISPDLAKALLKSSGYVWNPKEQKYVITEEKRKEMHRNIVPM